MSRQYCPKCMKAMSTCICQWLQVQSNQMPVLILQHSDEVKKTLGTARLVELGLTKAKVVSGTAFKRADCFDVLGSYQASQPILLYAHQMPESPFHIELDSDATFTKVSELSTCIDSIIVLDGTWRNTRELLHLNAWFQTLPTIALKNVGVSQYRIRKASKADALATIEAISVLLSIFDEQFDSNVFLRPFEKMIDAQIDKMGEALYQQNYQTE